MRPNIDGALRRALEQPTLLAALTWMAEWENERIVEQARREKTWDSCFGRCLQLVLDSWTAHRDLGAGI